MGGTDLVLRGAPPAVVAAPRLLDRVRLTVRLRHYSRRTEEAYVTWVRRYVLFHGRRHPSELGPAHVAAFLSSLATTGRVSASTQNQALSALTFLYRVVLGIDLGNLPTVVRAHQPQRLPVVLDRSEVRAVLAELKGAAWLVAALLYGAGLRLNECLELRVKDIDFARYHSSVAVLWLLLVLDSRRPSGWFDLDGAALDAVYDSLFARTFVFDRFSATIHELETRLPGSHPAG